MALDIAADQQALHNTSKSITDAIKGKYVTTWDLWSVPRYSTVTSNGVGPVIPSADIFKPLFSPGDGTEASDKLPSIAKCAVHLEFLAALHALRKNILESEELDVVFDTTPNHPVVIRRGVETQLKDTTMWTRRQAKWDTYVELAVIRFLASWEKVPEMAHDNGRVDITSETLPPIDVLMVWHAFLLNPRYFRRLCENGKKPLYQIEFPWASIHQALQSEDWLFTSNKAAAASFLKATGLGYSLIDSLLEWAPLGHRHDILEAARFSLTSSELGLSPARDEPILQYYVTANETTAQELKEAILRQVSFVGKMNEKLWIRSPALEGTVRRARDRYQNFLKLFKLYPTTMFVPTIDIDLVWHTHQCSAARYHETTLSIAGKFVNHDDSIVQGMLDTGLEKTKSLYRIRFGQEYTVCGCWDCQALLSAVEDSEKGGETDLAAIAKNVSLDVSYYRAVEVARETKKPLPIR